MSVEQLFTPRLRLRRLRQPDAPRLAELGGERAIADTMISVPHPFPPTLAADWIAQQSAPTAEQETFAICPRDDPQLIGSIRLVDLDCEHGVGELSFWIGRPFWGSGFATEAGGVVVAWAFEQLDLNRLQAYHMVRNTASARVLAHLHFRPEGILRQRVRKWGVFEDVVICGLTRDDWRGPPQAGDPPGR